MSLFTGASTNQGALWPNQQPWQQQPWQQPAQYPPWQQPAPVASAVPFSNGGRMTVEAHFHALRDRLTNAFQVLDRTFHEVENETVNTPAGYADKKTKDAFEIRRNIRHELTTPYRRAYSQVTAALNECIRELYMLHGMIQNKTASTPDHHKAIQAAHSKIDDVHGKLEELLGHIRSGKHASTVAQPDLEESSWADPYFDDWSSWDRTSSNASGRVRRSPPPPAAPGPLAAGRPQGPPRRR
jgi:hypothetical protein